MNNKQKSRLMLIFSLSIFGTIGIFTRAIAVSSSELALYRAILATILILCYFLVTKQSIDFAKIKKDIPLLALSGVFMGVNWIFLFEAYKYTTISVATISYSFAPTIVTVACLFLFKEKLTIKKAVCFIMSTIGLILTIGFDSMEAGSSNLKGVLFGISAAVLYATIILINKKIKNVSGIERTLLQFCSAIVILTPYVVFASGITIQNLDLFGIFLLLIVGFVHTGITYCLYFSALKDLPGQEIAILSYLDPLVAVILSVFVVGESISPLQILGAFFILGFTLLNELSHKSE